MWTTGRLAGSIDDVVTSGQALQLSQMADMMHDAIRGDVQQALLGAIEKKAEGIAEAEGEGPEVNIAGILTERR
ncbi:MAG: hypothetical protein U1F00_14480 [Rhodoferax sp.]